MATPILLTDVNANFIPRSGQPFNICILDYKLGDWQTIEARSGWAFDESELTSVLETGIVFLRVWRGQPPICLFHAGITEFEGQNVIYRLEDCNDLPTFTREVYVNGEYIDEITSAWRLNETGLAELKQNGYVIISIVGGMTDVQVFGENPSVSLEKGDKYGEC